MTGLASTISGNPVLRRMCDASSGALLKGVSGVPRGGD